MSTVRDLHDKASELAQQARLARYEGNMERAEDLARKAFQYESRAAELVPAERSSEPTRSILYLSAASLAYQSKHFDVARRFIARGLSGYPPSRLEQELKDLFQQVGFEEHLQASGVVLEETDLELSLAGKSVGHGMVLYSELKRKIEHTIDLVNKSVERRLGRKYRSQPGRPRSIYRPFFPALSAARAGSFSVTLRLGVEEGYQESFLFSASEVIDEILTGISLINTGNEEGLRALISDDAYRSAFRHLTRSLAPDGEKISSVGFRSTSRSVHLTKTRSEIALPDMKADEGEVEREPIEIHGLLDYAMSRGEQKTIGINPEDRKPYEVIVREGMEDVVRTYFGEWVVIKGTLVRDAKGNERVNLRDVEPADI